MKKFSACLILFILFIASSANADPPASFMNSPFLYSLRSMTQMARGNYDPGFKDSGFTVKQFYSSLKTSGTYTWKEIYKDQWRLTIEEIDKMTDKKGVVIILFVKDPKGVKITRIIFDGEELDKMKESMIVQEWLKSVKKK